MSDENLPVPQDMYSLLGISAEDMAAEIAVNDKLNERPRFEFKVDTIGKYRMITNQQGQFNPVPPGDEKSKVLADSLTILIVGSKFWPQKMEEQLVENKDGKKEPQRRTVCEGRSHILPGTEGPDGKPVRKDKGWVTIPQFGLRRTVEEFDFHGSQISDEYAGGVCVNCPYSSLKGSPDGCKLGGSITAIVFKHDGENVDPYITELRCNYTSCISFARFVADARKQKFGGDPTKIVVRITLTKNTQGVQPYWEMAFSPVMKLDEVPVEAVNEVRSKALTKFAADKTKAEEARNQKQLVAAKGEVPPF